jgi:hypothetical protein
VQDKKDFSDSLYHQPIFVSDAGRNGRATVMPTSRPKLERIVEHEVTVLRAVNGVINMSLSYACTPSEHKPAAQEVECCGLRVWCLGSMRMHSDSSASIAARRGKRCWMRYTRRGRLSDMLIYSCVGTSPLRPRCKSRVAGRKRKVRYVAYSLLLMLW